MNTICILFVVLLSISCYTVYDADAAYDETICPEHMRQEIKKAQDESAKVAPEAKDQYLFEALRCTEIKQLIDVLDECNDIVSKDFIAKGDYKLQEGPKCEFQYNWHFFMCCKTHLLVCSNSSDWFVSFPFVAARDYRRTNQKKSNTATLKKCGSSSNCDKNKVPNK